MKLRKGDVICYLTEYFWSIGEITKTHIDHYDMRYKDADNWYQSHLYLSKWVVTDGRNHAIIKIGRL